MILNLSKNLGVFKRTALDDESPESPPIVGNGPSTSAASSLGDGAFDGDLVVGDDVGLIDGFVVVVIGLIDG